MYAKEIKFPYLCLRFRGKEFCSLLLEREKICAHTWIKVQLAFLQKSLEGYRSRTKPQ